RHPRRRRRPIAGRAVHRRLAPARGLRPWPRRFRLVPRSRLAPGRPWGRRVRAGSDSSSGCRAPSGARAIRGWRAGRRLAPARRVPPVIALPGIGSHAGWHLDFRNGPGDLDERVLAVSSSEYYASIDATLPSGLDGGSYSFVIEGMSSEHYSRLAKAARKSELMAPPLH